MSLFADRAAGAKSKVTVNLLRRHIALLDHLAIEVRHKGRFYVTRSDLIEAVIDAWQLSGVDLSDACSAEEIAEAMREAWSGKRKR